MVNKERIYRISFMNQHEIFEVYAKKIQQSPLMGFIEVAELIFGNTTELVVDPSQERLKNELNGVKKSHVPIHSIIRIDEVNQEGVAKVKELNTKDTNVMPFPMSLYTQPPVKTD